MRGPSAPLLPVSNISLVCVASSLMFWLVHPHCFGVQYTMYDVENWLSVCLVSKFRTQHVKIHQHCRRLCHNRSTKGPDTDCYHLHCTDLTLTRVDTCVETIALGALNFPWKHHQLFMQIQLVLWLPPSLCEPLLITTYKTVTVNFKASILSLQGCRVGHKLS